MELMSGVRRATVDDAAGIAQVHVDSWRQTYQGVISDSFLRDLSYERRQAFWKKHLSAPENPATAYVATAGEQDGIVGFAAVGAEQGEKESFDAELFAIYVLRSYQGCGLGRALLHAGAAHLAAAGYESMLLWVLEDNPSRGFYERFGGEVVGEKRIDVGDQKLPAVAYGWESLQELVEATAPL